MTDLVIIRGLPGSGKTTMAKRDFHDYVLCEADQYFGSPYRYNTRFRRHTMLKPMEMRLLYEVYEANACFGIPHLPSASAWKRAARLADAGLLKRHDLRIVPPSPGADGYSITEAGITAYNENLQPNA